MLRPRTATEQFTENMGGISIDGGQLRLLWNAVSQLINDVNGLPGEGGYGELTDAFLPWRRNI